MLFSSFQSLQMMVIHLNVAGRVCGSFLQPSLLLAWRQIQKKTVDGGESSPVISRLNLVRKRGKDSSGPDVSPFTSQSSLCQRDPLVEFLEGGLNLDLVRTLFLFVYLPCN